MVLHFRSQPSVTEFGFPQSKDEIERHIVDLMLGSANKQGLNPFELVGEPVQNPENNFDFTIPTPSGEEYLDLMEIAPLDIVGGTHETAPASYMSGEFADIIMTKILTKSQGYGRAPRALIHLLL